MNLLDLKFKLGFSFIVHTGKLGFLQFCGGTNSEMMILTNQLVFHVISELGLCGIWVELWKIVSG